MPSRNSVSAVLEADISLQLAPEGGFPAIDFELLGIEACCGHRGICRNNVIGGGVLRAHFEPTLATIGPTGQTVDREAEVGQDLIIDDVVKKNSIRIEGVLRQDDAVVECSVLGDDRSPLRSEDEHRQFLMLSL